MWRIGLLVILLICACTPVAPPVPTTTLAQSLVQQPTVAQSETNPVTAQVTRVVDGDTIEVSLNGKKYEVRYIGIDTPELAIFGKPTDYFGPEAAAKNTELVGGKAVILEKDVSDVDRFNRLLRYVYVGSLFVNAEMVRTGYAQTSTYPPDVKYQDQFLELQRQAKQSRLGLWAYSDIKAVDPSSGNTIPTAYIGNKNSKKFHKSTCSSVKDMKEYNKVPLNSRTEAISLGYVPCKICKP